jgi:ABC-type glycerol-3-phosphate transport system substrate-binding protein
MAQSQKKDLAWEFVKWWTGTDAQLSYATSLESLMGSSARYAAADPEVLKQLPWSNRELEALLDQIESTVGISALPGNYMTSRMIQYAFQDVVGEEANPREALYLNVKDINQELYRKRIELHLSVRPQTGGEVSEK